MTSIQSGPTDSGRVGCAETGSRWRPVPGFGGLYIVARDGEIASLYFDPPKTLAPVADADGYLKIRLTKNGRRETLRLHRIVCEAFNGPGNALRCEVAHLDNDRSNCRADNLQWVSRVENCSHKARHGTAQRGENHPRAILNEDAVRRISTRYATSKEIAREYGVSRHAVFDIWQGKNWTHVR